MQFNEILSQNLYYYVLTFLLQFAIIECLHRDFDSEWMSLCVCICIYVCVQHGHWINNGKRAIEFSEMILISFLFYTFGLKMLLFFYRVFWLTHD